MSEWQKARSEFNHDWLKLKYLNALQSFIDRLEADDPGSPARLQEFIEIDFPAWREHSSDAWWLVQHFEHEMSPKTLFNIAPLINCSNKTKVWLEPLEHELWLLRCGVKQRVENAADLISNIDDEFAKLSASIPALGESYLVSLQEMLPRWKKFAGACFKLSQCMSEFPHRIEVL